MGENTTTTGSATTETSGTEAGTGTVKTTEQMIDEALKGADSGGSEKTDDGKKTEKEKSSEKSEETKTKSTWGEKFNKIKNILKDDDSEDSKALLKLLEDSNKESADLLKENEALKQKNATLEDITSKVLNRVEALENKSKQSDADGQKQRISEQIKLAKDNGALKPNDTAQEEVFIKLLAADFDNTVKVIQSFGTAQSKGDDTNNDKDKQNQPSDITTLVSKMLDDNY